MRPRTAFAPTFFHSACSCLGPPFTAIIFDNLSSTAAALSASGQAISPFHAAWYSRTGILHNDLYVGRLIWNKQRYVKDPTTGKRLARVNPEREWIAQNVPELRILDQELWEAAQDRLAEIRGSVGVQKARATQF